jgi:DNA-binding response OmpR family regulator
VREEKIKVLIIDDDEIVVEITTAGLELNGFEVFSAVDGGTGIEKINEKRPDVVLLDLRLPDIDGFEVLRQLRAKPDNSGMHVIMITGDRTIDIDKAFAFGADDCIIKPIDMNFLAERIKKLTKKKYRVLIVEDDRQLCVMLRNVLENQDYEVEFYHDGSNLLDTVIKNKPDVLLLDISLPTGPDGTELCKTLKNNNATKMLPVIMLTANEHVSSVEKCFSFGAEDYIFKPFKIPDLISKIKKHLRISSRNR